VIAGSACYDRRALPAWDRIAASTAMEILINAANILYVTAYFTMDMLRLRVLTLTAACCLAVYFYSQPVPMLNVVAWNVFFIMLNMSQVVRLVMARYKSGSPSSPD
jgi:hypothetical protein